MAYELQSPSHFDYFVGEVGVVIGYTVRENGNAVDLSGATPTLYLRRPDGTVLTKTTGVAGTSGGALTYSTVAGDLNGPGPLRVSAKLVTGGVTRRTNEFVHRIRETIL